MVASVTRSQVLAFRVRAQMLDLPAARLADITVLDIGVQDSGRMARSGLWRLATYRRVPLSGIDFDE
jgi:hypothetical protein